jgi:hypothetical protein
MGACFSYNTVSATRKAIRRKVTNGSGKVTNSKKTPRNKYFFRVADTVL